MEDREIISELRKSGGFRRGKNLLNNRFFLSSNFKGGDLEKAILSRTEYLLPESTLGERIYHILNQLQETPKCNCGNIKKYKKSINLGYSSHCSVSCSKKYKKGKSCSEFKLKNRDKVIKMLINHSKTREYSKEEIFKFYENNKPNPSIVGNNIDLFKAILDTTNFLPTFNYKHKEKTICWSERIYCIKHNITLRKICKCGDPLPFKNSVIGYSSYCSKKCKHITETSRMMDYVKTKGFYIESVPDKLKNSHVTLTCIDCNNSIKRILTNGRWKTIECPTCILKSGSRGQRDIEKYIKDLGNYRVVTNDRSILDSNLELDIFLPKFNIAIEYNGNYWHLESQGKDKKYHLNKTVECLDKGIELFHIFESEWTYQKDIWKSILLNKLGLSNKIYARKCKILEVDTKPKNDFLEKCHLQGRDNSSINVGLFMDDKMVSIMTFCKSRFNSNYEWEISRFCNDLNITVVGGASKLFNYFIKTYNPKNVITYSNRRYSNGNLYKNLGFSFSHNSSPNYFYVALNNRYELLSRQKFQKHKLKNILKTFDPALTEWENMKMNKYDRIWDCGNGVWARHFN